MSEAQQPESRSKAGMLGGLGILGVLLLKFKFYIFAALKGLSFLKLGWLFKSFIMFFISLGVYWALFGPVFAVVLLIVILIHELGHYIWMRAYGLNPKPIIFVPGIGAFTAMEKMPGDQATDAWVSLAGPLVGGVASAAFYYYGVLNQSLFLMAVGSVGFYLNLIQLIPAKPLDGGFVISAINKWLLVPGIAIIIAGAIYLKSIIFSIIAVIAFINLIHQFKNPNAPPMRGGRVQEAATMPQKVIISIAYFGLAGMLGYLYWMSHEQIIHRLPAQHKSKAMKYHHTTPDHESFSEEESSASNDGDGDGDGDADSPKAKPQRSNVPPWKE